MALDNKTLRRFLDNPAMFSAEDMELEQEIPADVDGSMDIPEIDPEADLLNEAPEIADPDEINQQNDLAQDEQVASLSPEISGYKVSPEVSALSKEIAPSSDSDMVAKLKRLKSGEPMDETSQQEDQEIASDMKAPIELRKKALQKIKQKYLGQ